MGARFRAITIFEGVDTGDKRTIAPGALTHRALPMSLMSLFETPEFGGHGGATVVGSITEMSREDATSWIDEATGQTWGEVAGGQVWAWIGTGEFADTDDAIKAEDLVRGQHLRGVSADLAAMEAEVEILEEDDEGWPTDWLETMTSAEIAAATVCNVPAFRGCTIELIEDTDQDGEPGEPEEEPAGAGVTAAAEPWLPAFRVLPAPRCAPCEVGAVTASGGPLDPPGAWFADPGLGRPTPLTVTADGRVFGHLAAWGTCHTGFAGQCVTPPRSSSGYALFRTGAVLTAEGQEVPVGHITLGTGHADLHSDYRAAAAHYDNTGTVVADVAAGEDEHGVWVAGAIRPDVTEQQVRALRAAPLSGDWRRYGSGLEMVAALAVNTPGFPVPRVSSLAASGRPSALVAAGARPLAIARQAPDTERIAGQVRTLVAAAVAPLLPAAKAAHLARIRSARANRGATQ